MNYEGRIMIVAECKSTNGSCPCLWCDDIDRCGPCTSAGSFDTEYLCTRARKYCEKVNGYGREEDKSRL